MIVPLTILLSLYLMLTRAARGSVYTVIPAHETKIFTLKAEHPFSIQRLVLRSPSPIVCAMTFEDLSRLLKTAKAFRYDPRSENCLLQMGSKLTSATLQKIWQRRQTSEDVNVA